MADGEVVLRTATGQYQDGSQIGVSAQASFRRFQGNWNNYTAKLLSSGVEEYVFFGIDLNRFTSGSSRIKVLTYR